MCYVVGSNPTTPTILASEFGVSRNWLQIQFPRTAGLARSFLRSGLAGDPELDDAPAIAEAVPVVPVDVEALLPVGLILRS